MRGKTLLGKSRLGATSSKFSIKIADLIAGPYRAKLNAAINA